MNIEIGNMPASHSGEISGLAFNPVHHELIASSSMDKSIRLWDVRSR